MNLDEIAVRVAEKIPDFLWREGDTHEGGVVENQAIEFARRLLAEVQKMQEPQGYFYEDATGFWREAGDPINFSGCTPLYKALEIEP